MKWSAVVPLAFFAEPNIEMTMDFLETLDGESFQNGTLYLNGGLEPWRTDGNLLVERFALTHPRFQVVPADGWAFYRMWNDGISRAENIAVVLNNDIEWTRFDLDRLVAELAAAPADVAAVYPFIENDTRGITGYCFAIRPHMAPKIDEAYITWYGDDELVLKITEAGNRTMPISGLNVRHKLMQTAKHRPGVEEERASDRHHFISKWAPK